MKTTIENREGYIVAVEDLPVGSTLGPSSIRSKVTVLRVPVNMGFARHARIGKVDALLLPLPVKYVTYYTEQLGKFRWSNAP